MKRSFKYALLAAAPLAIGLPAPLVAQASGVDALLEQARYWEERGRQDRAAEAYRRVLAIDPNNAEARRGLQPRAAPAPTPAPAPAPAAAAPAPPRQTVAEAYRPSAAELAGRDRAAGYEALEAGQLAEASRLFESALNRQPSDAESLGGLGLVRLRAERFVEARDLLTRASRLGSSEQWAEALGSAQFFAGLAEARGAFDAGRLADAQRLAEQLADSGYKEPAPAYQLLAAIYEQQGRLAEAALMSRRASEQKGTDPALVRRLQADALRQQALGAIRAGDLAAAEQLFQQGLLTDGSDPWIRYEFARFMIDRGRVSETESLIRSLAQMSNPEARYAAALLLDRLDRTGEAQSLMDSVDANQRSPEMLSFMAGLQIDAEIARARTLAAGGRGIQAATNLRQIAAAPETTPAKMAEIASVLHDLGDETGAADLARRALDAGPRDLDSYEPIIRVLTQTGQQAFALTALERVEQLAGDTPDGALLVNRLSGMIAAVQADQMREIGNYAGSFDLLQSAWNRAPGNVEILAALARLYQTGGMQLQAAQTFQMVLQQDSDDLGAMIGLIDTAVAVGEHGLAERTLRSALEQYPQDYNVYLAGARLATARGKDNEARAYLERARQIYLGVTGIGSGGFPAANPFATTTAARMATPAPVNPFSLGTDPQLSRNIGLGSAPGAMPQAPQGGFAQGGYAQNQYSQGGYAPAGASQGGYPPPGSTSTYSSTGFGAAPSYGGGGSGQVMPMQAAAYPAPGTPYSGQGASYSDAGAPGAVYSSDPVLDQIERDLRQLESSSGPIVEVQTSFRDRSGEPGLSSLQQIGAKGSASTGLAGGRVAISAEAVVLDAGQPSRSGLARFGNNGLIEAQAIVDEVPAQLEYPDAQHASGVALSASYKGDLIEADAGTTPLGFAKVEFAGGIAVTPRFSPYASGRLWAERRRVDDSVLSYAGAVDPVTRQFWGSVMRTGGGASFSWERDGTGFYGDGSYFYYDGSNVRDNHSFEVNAGGYFLGFSDRKSRLTFGVNANYQSFDNNQNFFTTGHGGYFSPQSFLSVSFPVRYTYSDDSLEASASINPGYQTYEQTGEVLYPIDAVSQTVLELLRADNPDVRANYDTISETGFGFSAEGSAYYRVLPRTQIGTQLQYNTFGQYNELQVGFGVRQTVGGGD